MTKEELAAKKDKLKEEFNTVKDEAVMLEQQFLKDKTRMVELQGAFQLLDAMEKELDTKEK